MKKLSKKLLFIVMIAIVGTISAAAVQSNAVLSANTEYTSYGISEAKTEKIVNSILGASDDTPLMRVNLLCLFGHSINIGTVQAIEHSYYTSDPKCKRTIYNVEYCGRDGCDYFTVTGEINSRLACH